MAEKLGKTVFVGVSGGVDSSVSAALLKDQGYNVVGVFIRTWQPDFIECTWRDERRDAMRVCAHLDIPFLECDGEEAYKKGVADYMIEEYKKGNTPNPDVMCNREVKFGVFWDFAKERGADFIATGHYAEVSEGINSFREATGGGVPFRGTARNGVKELREKLFMLKRSPDQSKDQSYFLWTLTEDDLAHTLFPIGHLQKSEVRKLADKYGLPTATKKDSQGVCFLGPLDMKDFLMHYIESKEGNVENTQGEVIGTHDGVLLYTLGERHGFNISKNSPEDKPYYIVAKDIVRNTLVVSHNKNETKNSKKDYKLEKVVIRGQLENKEYTAQIRYHGDFLPCNILAGDESNSLVTFTEPVIVSPGQSVVFYDNDICMGGGVVI
jgi:tRNA-specific 2-thiouridylase